ncbi:type IV pilus modification protein PilV [Lysobacter brunescens]|uniref:Type IV pilus modification protein PilV n=1 Tax=Lysobacter brunescens TaxID=262323 RepID=A0ABW2YHE4_9GAMM
MGTRPNSSRIASGRRRAPRTAAHARGVGLIEVLVAVLVLAIGLLGVAALQATALRNSQSSLERSQSVIHIYSIFDAMRANADAARGGAYNMPLTCAVPGGGSITANDQRQWIQTIQDNLGPTACGQVRCDGPTCTILVRWDDSRAGGASAQTYSFSTTSRI